MSTKSDLPAGSYSATPEPSPDPNVSGHNATIECTVNFHHVRNALEYIAERLDSKYISLDDVRRLRRAATLLEMRSGKQAYMHVPDKLDEYQDRVVEWGTKCFGVEHMSDPKVRAMRLLEECIEFAQAVGVSRLKAHCVVDYSYERPAGLPFQELGGIGVTFLAAAHAVDFRASDALEREIKRVESKPVEHFAKRNQEKLEAGLTGQ